MKCEAYKLLCHSHLHCLLSITHRNVPFCVLVLLYLHSLPPPFIENVVFIQFLVCYSAIYSAGFAAADAPFWMVIHGNLYWSTLLYDTIQGRVVDWPLATHSLPKDYTIYICRSIYTSVKQGEMRGNKNKKRRVNPPASMKPCNMHCTWRSYIWMLQRATKGFHRAHFASSVTNVLQYFTT